MAAFWVLFKQARRGQAVSDSPSLHAWVMAFNILSGLGFILLAVVFFTALLSSRVKRVSTWYCYMMAWMAFCITPFPVIGHQTHADPPPSFAPCVVNSALMYASRPLQVHFARDSGPSFETIFSAAFGTLSLILQLYLNVSARLRHREVRQGSVFVLLVIPPILYFITFIATLLLGIVKPTQVKLESGGFYCHVEVAHSLPAVIIACFVLFANVASVVIEGLHPQVPTAAALIFGSQTDIVHVWMFWRVEGKTMTQLTLTTMNSDCLGYMHHDSNSSDSGEQTAMSGAVLV
ncbi:hypothetical protein B0H13DRAFT_2434807 [Mycena leptocephala]|nr:hypothetical protein B0H13DRAFT_2434807 [Mycena leptocephala]